jgi:hypothetical protein
VEKLADIFSALNSANPVSVVAIVALSGMYFIYMIVKLFIGIIEKRLGGNE